MAQQKKQIPRKAVRTPRRARRDKRHEHKMQPAPRRDVELTAPVNWKVLPRTIYTLAESAREGSDFEAFRRLVVGITEPLRILESLTTLAERALAGNPFAEAEFRATVAGLGIKMAAPDSKPLAGSDSGARLTPDGDSPCGCDDRGVGIAAFGSPPAEPTLLDERGLSDLLVATARLHFRCDASTRERALVTVTNVIVRAGLIADLADAARSGAAAVGERLVQNAVLGALGWAARPTRTMMGPMPEMPQLPDLPSPGDKFPSLGGGLVVAFPKPGLDELLTRLRKPRQWDPEVWEPYPFWREPSLILDFRNLPFIRCALAVSDRIRARSQLNPPPRPSRVTWASGISGITTARATGACDGDKVVIHGKGLRQPNAVLLVPFADGCHVIAVPVANWTGTSITFTLPLGAISGPIGFGDANYIAAYDTWAGEQNRLAAEIEGMWCMWRDLAWVAPFRECPPDVGVNRIRGGSAVIDAFTANGETLLVLEPDAAATLQWAVRNADYVDITSTIRTSAGKVLPGGPTISNPTGSSWPLKNLGFGNLNPIAIIYRLVAYGPCGTVFREVTIVISKRPGLYFDNIEVTQGIQTLPPTVRLVANKPTVVRVMLGHQLRGCSGDRVPNVTGSIRVRRPGGQSDSQLWNAANGSKPPMAATAGAKITVERTPLRIVTDHTLNFLIPPAWCTDGVRFEIEARVVGFGAIGPFAGYDQAVTFLSGPYAFFTRRTLEVRYNFVSWDGKGLPTTQQCFDTIRDALPYLPTPGANILPPIIMGISTGSGDPNNKDKLNEGKSAFIAQADFVHNFSSLGDIWVFLTTAGIGGRAADIPSNTLVSQTNGEVLAHELGHCFDQVHVNVCGAQGGEEAFPLWGAGGTTSRADIAFHPIKNTTVVNAQELMGYCLPRWTAPLRWNRLWDQIGS